MKLEHKILCIDDDIASLEEHKHKLKKFNEKVGIETSCTDLEAKATARETDADFKKRIKRDLKEKFKQEGGFDLILIDLNMKDIGRSTGKPIDGAYFIELIRDKHTMYRPIIFYSGGSVQSDGTAKELYDKIQNDPDLLGKNLIICQRTNLSNILEKLAEDMHKEEHKVNNVRGFLMDSVSEIDALMIEAIRKLWVGCKRIKKNNDVIEEVKERIESREKQAKELSKEINGYKTDNKIIEYILNEDNIKKMDTSARGRILYKMLSLLNGKTEKNTLTSLLSIRNKYAHQTAEQIQEWHDDNDNLKKMRVEIRKHIKKLEEILQVQQG